MKKVKVFHVTLPASSNSLASSTVSKNPSQSVLLILLWVPNRTSSVLFRVPKGTCSVLTPDPIPLQAFVSLAQLVVKPHPPRLYLEATIGLLRE